MQSHGATTSSEWVFVAKSLLQLPNCKDQALSCMARAQLVSESVGDWVDLAYTWLQSFEDTNIAWQCLEKAEGVADEDGDEDSLVRIAEVWVDTGHYDQAARILREYVAPREWPYLTELKEIYGNLNDGTTPRDWVEPGMTARASSDTVADAEAHFGANKLEAIRLLVEAEKRTSSTHDWLRIARAWSNEFGGSASTDYCMKEAKEAVDDGYDWIRLSNAYKNNLHDEVSAISCLKEAEDAVGSDKDCWELILSAWKAEYQDPDNYLRSVEKCAIAMEDSSSFGFVHNALSDDFVHQRFLQKQAFRTDLGTTSENGIECVGVWLSEWISERRPYSFARHYNFTINQRQHVRIFLQSDEDNREEPAIYLVDGPFPNGPVLGVDSGSLSLISQTLEPGTYTIEACIDAETALSGIEVFTLKLRTQL